MTSKTLGGHSFSLTPDVLGVPLLLPSANLGVEVQSVSAVVAAQSGTSTVALTNSTPTQASAGTVVWSQSITPKYASSDVEIQGSFLYDSSNSARQLVVSVFRGTVCVGVTLAYLTTSGKPVPVSISFNDSPSSITAQTYTIYVGQSSSGTWYVGQATSSLFNGMLAKGVVLLKELS